MTVRIEWLLCVLLVLCASTAHAQSVERQKTAVVRITSESDGLRRTGSGFIVRVEPDAVFIVTAAHVVAGDKHPHVEFFTRRNTLVTAETVHIEGADPRGLALLAVRGKDNLPAGLAALPLASGSDLQGGEAVTIIGFPQGGGAWAVLRASVVSLEGRELTLDGSIGEGNSGGPVLFGETVVGVVTTVGGTGGFGHAVPGTIVHLVLDGWGVQAASTPGPARAHDEGGASPRPPVEPGTGKVRISSAQCEKLRASTGFRITLYGDASGPAGAAAVAAFLRDSRLLSRPRISCDNWTNCTRGDKDPEKTAWKVSVLAPQPAPTEALISLMSAGSTEEPQRAGVQARRPLDCLLQ